MSHDSLKDKTIYISADDKEISLRELRERVLSINDYVQGTRALLQKNMDDFCMDDVGIIKVALAALAGIQCEVEALFPDYQR